MAIHKDAAKTGTKLRQTEHNRKVAEADAEKDDRHFAEKVELGGISADKKEVADDVDKNIEKSEK